VLGYTQDCPSSFRQIQSTDSVPDQQKRPLVPLNYEILKEAWTGKEANLNHLRTFGYISYVYVELDHMSKLNPKFKMCILIVYGTNEYVN